jgi:uncharacterized protein YjbJ (UPF0337 family)
MLLAKKVQLAEISDNEHRPIEGKLEAISRQGEGEVGRLTDDDWKVIEGKCDQLLGKIQERYGITREEAERQLGDFERTHERM